MRTPTDFRIRLRSLSLAAALALAAPALAAAQQVQGSLSLGGGIATDQRGIRSSAATLAPSVLFLPDPRLSLGISGSLTQFQGHDWAAGAGASAGVRVPVAGPVALAASAGGNATTTSFHTRYLSADATPTIEATVRALTLYGGAHLAQGTTSSDASASPGLPPSPSAPLSITRTSAGPVFGAVMAVPTDRPDVGGTVSYREERARVARVDVTDRAVTGSWSAGPIGFSASAGMRDATDERVQYGSLGATLAIGRAIALQGGVGTYPSSRILGTLGGQYASLGVVLRGASRLDDAHLPAVVRGAPPAPAGATRVVIKAPGASRVEIAGEWNNWATSPAMRAADGSWYADVRLPRGEYRYAFRVDGTRWQVPDGVAAVDDGFGGRSALLVVP